MSSPACTAWPPCALSISLVIKPCRNLRASAPPTLRTARDGKRLHGIGPYPALLLPRLPTFMGAGEAPQEKPDLAQTFDLVIKGGTVANSGRGACRYWASRRPHRRDRLDRRCQGGRDYRRLGAARSPRCDRHPGAFPRAGLEHKEDLETGSRSAVLGGVTAVFEMPNTKPPTTSAARSPPRSPPRPTACIATSPSSSAPPATMSTISPNWSFSRWPPASRSSWALPPGPPRRRRGDARPHPRHDQAPRCLPFGG